MAGSCLRSGLLRSVLCGLALVALACRPVAVIAQDEGTAIRRAIERGIIYLQREQRTDGSWPERPMQPGGVTSLCTLALLNAGVNANDPSIQRALRYLRSIGDPEATYATSLQTMVFCLAEPKRDFAQIQRNVKWLEEAQVKNGPMAGGWGYHMGGFSADNSNGQYAVLALHEAERVGAAVSETTWRGILGQWTRTQNADGSWGYQKEHPGTGSMTCAGICSALIAIQRLEEGDAQVQGDQVLCCANNSNNSVVERGLAWLSRNFSVRGNPGDQGHWLYYMYGLERTGRMSALRFFEGPQGKFDWYREGSAQLLIAQDRLSGFWSDDSALEREPTVSTSFALLFLGKGRRPVLMSKLQYGPDTGWNRHRRDVANLTQYTELRWHRDLSWQIIDSNAATAEDYRQSPVLFMNGRDPIILTDEQVKALRKYVDRGGFIFAEACCQGSAFEESFRELMVRMFPEPEYDLKLLSKEHPIWTIEEPVNPEYVKPLWGVDVGCRTSVVFCPDDLSCFWELARTGREDRLSPAVRSQVASAKAIGINVLAYATNRELKFKYEINPEGEFAAPSDPLARSTLFVAKLRHTGGWDQAPAALSNLLNQLSHELGIHVNTEKRDLALTDPQVFQYHMVFMHGRHAFRLSATERAALKTYVSRGGLLVADAICGSEEFAKAFRQEMAAIFPENPLTRIPQDDPIFTSGYGGFDLPVVKRRDPQEGADGALSAVLNEVPPHLESVTVEGRMGVVFSPFDLSCALENHASVECHGYTKEDAARLGINIILYSLHE